MERKFTAARKLHYFLNELR